MKEAMLRLYPGSQSVRSAHTICAGDVVPLPIDDDREHELAVGEVRFHVLIDGATGSCVSFWETSPSATDTTSVRCFRERDKPHTIKPRQFLSALTYLRSRTSELVTVLIPIGY